MHPLTQTEYEQALALATAKHQGQFRIGGLPYITHPVAVAEYLKKHEYPLAYQIAGLFHDLLEDTDVTEAELTAIAGEEVVAAVKLLTKTPGYVMGEYIAGIKSNPIALAVKGADRLHNLQCALVADEKFRRRYIAETHEWYMDFNPEIPAAVKALEETLSPK